MNESSEANEVRGELSAAAPMSAESSLPVEVPPLPGRFLREARETANLTVFEVAQSLKFSARQIEALEADDFGALPPGNTFQRGFVRGYAKLLKLDPLPLLAMLDARAPAALPDVRAPQNMGVAATPVTARRRSSRPMMLASAALGAVAVALAVWNYLGMPSAPVAARSAPAAAPASETTAVQAPEIRVEQAPAVAATGPAAGPAAGTAAAGPATAVAAPPDLRQLVFTFQDKSWVEVTDATQHVIFSAENAPGTRQAVSGKPPFQIVVGNAAKVELQYDDHQVDLKPYTRAEVARLTLQ
ncbi:MAG: helix-turn-helix domain-containing protein [Rhodocyclaceae bacterium]|nr:helix-turn-helix domain-containing protein [Rhodocyclaceae bacterium]